MNDFEVGEVIRGVNVGIFRIVEFRKVGDLDGVEMKQVHPDTLEDGPHPILWHSFDMIKKF